MASWADLPPDLLGRIGECLDLKYYVRTRGACAAWRRALAPPFPALLVVAGEDWGSSSPSAASLLLRRSFELTEFVSYSSLCVGSSNSWIAISVAPYLKDRAVFVLLNHVTAAEVVLPPLICDIGWTWVVSKVVFAPSPTKDDFAAAAICGVDRIAYVTAGARRWAVLDPIRLAGGDHLTDLVYHDQRKVYCLTRCGNVHILRLLERRRREVVTIKGREPEFSVLRPPEHIPLWRSRNQHPSRAFCLEEISGLFGRHSPESRGQHHNARATVEPLLSEGNLQFNPGTAFGPPYDIVSVLTGAKNLVFCEGSLYQVWRNTSCTVTLQLSGGGSASRVER